MENQPNDVEKLDEYITAIGHYFSKNFAFLKGDDISPKQFMLMRMLSKREKSTVSDLAEDLGLSTSATTIALNRLVQGEWVTRFRDEQDRRVVWVRITEKAEKLVASMMDRRRELMSRLIMNLTEEERSQLKSLVKKMMDNTEMEVGE